MAAVANGIALGIERKLTGNELQQSEERFRELAENIREIFYIAGPRGAPVHYVSPAFEEITGRSRKGFEGNPGFWLELIHPDDRSRVEQAQRAGPHALDTEYRFVRPDGAIRWIHTRSFPVRDPAGTTVRIVGIAEDITERKRAEEKVYQNLERIRALHDIDTAISSTLDLRTVLSVLLEKIELFLPIARAVTVRLLNRETGELESLACRGLDEQEWKVQPIKTLAGRGKRIVETKAPLAVRDIHHDPDKVELFGKHSLVSYLGVPLIAKEKVLGVLGLYTNEEHEFTGGEVEFLMTLAGQAAIAIHNAQLYAETDQSQKDLQTTNQYLNRSLKQLDSLYTALTPLSPSRSVRETNEGILERLMAATGADAALIRLRDQQTGSYVFSGHRGFPAAYIDRLQTVPEGGALEWVVKHREPIIAPDIALDPRFKGKLQIQFGFHSAALLPLEVRDEVRGVVHLASAKLGYFDLEQRHHLTAIGRQMGIALENKDLYENLRASKDELEKAVKVKDEFLSVISHELKTPLIVLMEYANVLKDGMMGKVNEEQEKALIKLLGAAAEQLKMINMILQTTQLESGVLSSEHQFIEIRDLLQGLQSEYETRSSAKHVTLSWNCPAEPMEMVSDSAKLEQILRNLIDNAIKFTEHGSVTISANNCATNRTVKFTVTDTGIGIAKAHYGAIFEKLYQVESSDNRRYEGIGLGLYIVKKFSELIGATVEVKSELGAGSTFTLTVPWQ
jgi:PAS domain S-box-containing protein